MKKKIQYSVIFASLCLILFAGKQKTALGAVLIDTTQGVSTSTLQSACTATDAGGYTAGGSLLSVNMGQMPLSVTSGTISIIFWSTIWSDYDISNYANFTIGSTTPAVTFTPEGQINGVWTQETAVLSNVTAQAGDNIVFNASIGNQDRFNCMEVLADATSTYVNSLNGGDNTRHWNDPYFILLDNQTLNFWFPTNGTTTPDFSYWQVSSLDLSTTSYYRVDVTYNMVGSTAIYNDYNIQNSPEGYGIFTIPKNNPLWYAPLATTTQWNATAFLSLCDPNDLSACASSGYSTTTIASTSITFFVNNGTPIATSTPSSNCNFTSSSFWVDPMGNTENALCNAFFSMFTLSASDTQNISNNMTAIYSQIEQKPPFGYFNSISSAIGSMVADTSTQQLINTSTTASFGAVFTPLRNGIAVLFGLLFIFWLIWRITHFEL